MSLYTIAAASLTTPDDRKRRPAVNTGQVARTLVLCLTVALTIGLVHHQVHAAPEAPRSVVQGTSAP